MLRNRLVVPRLLASILAVAFSVQTHAQDWTQFRGPNGTGISSSTNLPVEFGPDKSCFWKTPLPAGHSSPVIANERIFLTGFEGEKLFTIGLELKTGEVLWKREVPHSRSDRLQKPNNPASPTPVTDGQTVVVFFQDFGLLAYDRDGQERWRVPLGPFNSAYGMGASPILVSGLVILPCDQDQNSFMIAVEIDTGRTRWKIDRPGIISGYSTPIVYAPKGGRTQVLVPESFQLSAYAADTGDRIWFVRGLACEMKSIPVLKDETLFINGWGWGENQPGKQVKVMSFEEALKQGDADHDGKISLAEGVDERTRKQSYFEAFDLDRSGKIDTKEWDIYRAQMSAENGLLSINLGGQGDMTQNAIRWKYTRTVPQVPSTLLYQGVLYMVNDGGLLLSFKPETGEVIKHDRLVGAIDNYLASPVAADGKLFFVSQSGKVSVVKAGGDWSVLKVNPLNDTCSATPAIAGGRIYIRSQSTLFCFGTMN